MVRNHTRIRLLFFCSGPRACEVESPHTFFTGATVPGPHFGQEFQILRNKTDIWFLSLLRGSYIWS